MIDYSYAFKYIYHLPWSVLDISGVLYICITLSRASMLDETSLSKVLEYLAWLNPSFDQDKTFSLCGLCVLEWVKRAGEIIIPHREHRFFRRDFLSF